MQEALGIGSVPARAVVSCDASGVGVHIPPWTPVHADSSSVAIRREVSVLTGAPAVALR